MTIYVFTIYAAVSSTIFIYVCSEPDLHRAAQGFIINSLAMSTYYVIL